MHIEPNNRRCSHCGTRSKRTWQQTVSGFRVRLCMDCWAELVRYLDQFCAMRPILDDMARLRAGRI